LALTNLHRSVRRRFSKLDFAY